MRVTASIAVLFLCAIFLATDTEEANAMAPNQMIFEEPASIFDQINTIKTAPQETEEQATAEEAAAVSGNAETEESDQSKDQTKEKAKQKSKKKKVIKYKVKSGDTLTKIAKKHDTTWKRLFFKNKRIDNPDMIAVGDMVVIPRENEKLKKRRIPQPEPVTQTVQAEPAATQQTATQVATQSAPAAQPAAAAPQPQPVRQQVTRGSSAGNTYYAGYCTWYAKSRRQDLPNNLGNAITWVSRAAAQGIPTGSTPRAGAIGQQGNHVVYVESVNGNGTVTVSEMNFTGWNQISRRTVPASSFQYIY